jgi:hypothetical protein
VRRVERARQGETVVAQVVLVEVGGALAVEGQRAQDDPPRGGQRLARGRAESP